MAEFQSVLFADVLADPFLVVGTATGVYPGPPEDDCEDDDDCSTEITATYAQVHMLDALGEPVWSWSSDSIGEQGTATDVEVTSDGRIVVSGSSDSGTGTANNPCIKVFDVTGRLESVHPSTAVANAASTALGGDTVVLAGETNGGEDGFVELLQL